MREKANHTEKGRAAVPDGVGEKPTSVNDVAETMRGEFDGMIWAECRATPPQLSVFASLGHVFMANIAHCGDAVTPDGFDVGLIVLVKYGHAAATACRPPFTQSGRPYSKAYMCGFVRAATDVWRKCQAPINRPA